MVRGSMGRYQYNRYWVMVSAALGFVVERNRPRERHGVQGSARGRSLSVRVQLFCAAIVASYRLHAGPDVFAGVRVTLRSCWGFERRLAFALGEAWVAPLASGPQSLARKKARDRIPRPTS